jgi:hypothetical protein
MANTTLYYVNCNSQYSFSIFHQLKVLGIENKIEAGGLQIFLSDDNFSIVNQIVNNYNLFLIKGIIPSLDNQISQILGKLLNKKRNSEKIK